MPENIPTDDIDQPTKFAEDEKPKKQHNPKFIDAHLPDPGPSVLQSRKPIQQSSQKKGLRARHSEKIKAEKASGYIGLVNDAQTAVESLSGNLANRKPKEKKRAHSKQRNIDDKQAPSRDNQRQRRDNQRQRHEGQRPPRDGQRQRRDNQRQKNEPHSKRKHYNKNRPRPQSRPSQAKPVNNPNRGIPKRSESERRVTDEILSGKKMGMRALLKKLIAPLTGKGKKDS